MPIADKIKKGTITSTYAMKSAKESLTLQRKYGKDWVFDLSASNPVLDPPQVFRHKLKDFVSVPLEGKHRYMENAGYSANRTMVAEQLKRETGISFSMADVIMTCGSSGALNIIFKAIFNPGEDLIAFAPFYPEYISYVENYFGVCRVIPTDKNFTPDLSTLEAALSPRTKAIILNYPNNPTGQIYSDETLKNIGDLLTRKGKEFNNTIYAITDETYLRLVYDDKKCPRMFNHYVNSIGLTSYSGDLCISGERAGYAAVHPNCDGGKEVFGALIHANRTLGFINCPALMQNVVRQIPDTSIYLKDYQRKRDFLFDRLVELGYQVVKPAGAFFMLVKSPLRNDKAFVEILKEQLVLTIVGSEFHAPGYFRISYCVEDKTLEGAIPGFQKALANCC